MTEAERLALAEQLKRRGQERSWAEWAEEDVYDPIVHGDWDGRALAAVNGATLGFGDEVYGGLSGVGNAIDPVWFPDDYETARQDYRDRLDEYREAAPWESFGFEMAGGMALPLGAIGTTAKVATPLSRGRGGAFGLLAGDGEDFLKAWTAATQRERNAMLRGTVDEGFTVANYLSQRTGADFPAIVGVLEQVRRAPSLGRSVGIGAGAGAAAGVGMSDAETVEDAAIPALAGAAFGAAAGMLPAALRSQHRQPVATSLALRETGGTPPKVVKVNPDTGEGVLVHHGTNAKFDRFSMDKVGAGEGAQAYGHGLYVAESPSVARFYQRRIGAKDDDMERGVFYRVRMNVREDEVLDLDQDAAAVQDLLADIADELGLRWSGKSKTVKDAVIALEEGAGREAVQAAMRKRGIHAYKYLDQSSRSRGDGTHNYVVLDDSRLTIVEREEGGRYALIQALARIRDMYTPAAATVGAAGGGFAATQPHRREGTP